ncbi:MAG: translocation/assembly module TamB domain-containing protein [Polyangiaceae bacterium]|nr:translocation/assembly module TamB domain-containing protein [Polyangiaceae bacterium]
MIGGSVATNRRTTRQGRRDRGRVLAFALCIVFALIGALPLALGALVRLSPVRAWAARKTAALIERELGVAARYRVSLQAWPLAIDLEDVVVDADDGGSPVATIERIGIRPRLFSLLNGELDVGEVEVLGPRLRFVVANGELANLHPKLPATSASDERSTRAPFSALAVTDARIDATIEGTRIDTREVDLDVTAEEDGAFEIALRAGLSTVVRTHPMPGRQDHEDMVDEDTLCRLDARVHVDHAGLTIRRLTLRGAADFDPDAGTNPGCALAREDARNVELNLGAFRVDVPLYASSIAPAPQPSDAPLAIPPPMSGRVRTRLPIALAHRFVDLPWVTGSVGLDVEIKHDGSTTLPHVSGRLEATEPGLSGKVFATTLDADLSIADDVVRLSKVNVTWANGEATIGEAKVEPFVAGIPASAGPVDIRNMNLEGILRDLGVHPQSWITWTLEKGHFDKFSGTISPLSLEGPMEFVTKNFEIFDRPTTDPARGHMLALAEANLRANFMVRPTGIIIDDLLIESPKSVLRSRVSLQFRSYLDAQLFEGTRIDLSELTPLKNIPMSGIAEITAIGRGPFSRPKIEANGSITDFNFSIFSFGDVERARIFFEPFDIHVVDAHLRKGDSRIAVPNVHIDFDAIPGIIVDADIDTRAAPHLWAHDFYDIVGIGDDPRFADLDTNASGTARLHFVSGGPEDRCGTGRLRVKTKMHLERASLYGEQFDDGDADVDLDWDDFEASAAGMRLDVHSASLRKGAGTVLAGATVRPGGRVTGQAIATGIPIDRVDALGRWGKPFDGSISGVAELFGTVSQLEARADVRMTPIRIGSASLPASQMDVAMTAAGSSGRTIGWTRCRNPRTAPFDRAEYDRDLSSGDFRVSGKLAGGQIVLDDVRMTRQKHKVVTGRVTTQALDLGALANLLPGVAFSATPPHGKLDASFNIAKLPFDDLARTRVSMALTALELERGGRRVALAGTPGPILIDNDTLTLPKIALVVDVAGVSAPVTIEGNVARLIAAPELDLGLQVGPLDLSHLSAGIPSIHRARGSVDGNLRIKGPPSALRYGGSARLRDGELALRGVPVSIDDADFDVAVTSSEARILKGTAKVGGGEMSVTGRVPIRGFELGKAEASIVMRGVKVPLADGINMTADADLEASFKPSTGEDEPEGKNLPEIKGLVTLTSFLYSRPIALSLDLNQLASGTRRTTVTTYDPKNDTFRFDVNVVAQKPLRLSNNLVDMQLDIAPPGLALSGTNQRYGARGLLRILPDSKLRLRSNEFTVREGLVRFDDPLRLAPKVDVRAQTEYRRYASTAGASTAAADTSTSAAATASLGQQWRINLYAHGDEENLKLDLTSEPSLSQEDIVLLLTLGLTRAEMDRGLASSLGESVGLEALAAITGADKAVKTIVPIIDEFRFGTSYSSRTGRTEPTVTLGKRITDEVRATVTTGITENREVRSSIEWRLGRRMILQGAYDNTNDVSSSPLGNLGADLRWRIEFE